MKIERNIELFRGYKEFEGVGVASVIVKPDLKNIYKAGHELIITSDNQPKFSFKARLIDSKEEVHKELQIALGLSVSAAEITGEVEGKFNKTTTSENLVSYYFIEIRRECFSQSANFAKDTTSNFISPPVDLSTPELKKDFYDRYGKGPICKIVKGQLLIAVISLRKSIQNKIIEESLAFKLSVPIVQNTTIGASGSISNIVKNLQQFSIYNIFISSIGMDEDNLPNKTVDNVSTLKEKLEKFVTDSKSAANIDPKPVTPPPAPSKFSKLFGPSAKTQKLNALGSDVAMMKSQLDKVDSKISDNNAKSTSTAVTPSFAPISFSVCSYRELFGPKFGGDDYENLLRAVNRAIKFAAKITQCKERAALFLNHLTYIKNNGESFKLNRAKKIAIKDMEDDLSKMVNEYLIPALKTIEKNKFAFTDQNWDQLWSMIKIIADNLDQIDSQPFQAIPIFRFNGTVPEQGAALVSPQPINFINFLKSSFHLETIRSKYTPSGKDKLFRSERVSKYYKLEVPIEAEKLHFAINELTNVMPPVAINFPNPLPPNKRYLDDLTFQLIRKYPIHVQGKPQSSRLLHSYLNHLADPVPLIPELTSYILRRSEEALPRVVTALLGSKYNLVYNKVAIRIVKPVTPSAGVYRKFEISLFVQTSREVKPLEFKQVSPQGEVDLNDYNYPYEPDFKSDLNETRGFAGRGKDKSNKENENLAEDKDQPAKKNKPVPSIGTSKSTEKTPIQSNSFEKIRISTRNKNASGNNLNLLENGASPYYLYSMPDSMRLLLAIRRLKLNYIDSQNKPYSVKAVGEEFSAYRENAEHVFIPDSYEYENFKLSFLEDIDTITGQLKVGSDGTSISNKNQRWYQPPDLLILTVLVAEEIHWRVIRIKMDYQQNQIHILWDDPFGPQHFTQELKDFLLPTIKAGCEQLFRQYHQEDFVLTDKQIIQEDKTLQQQRDGNGSDCGPISFCNVESYIDRKVSNNAFATADDASKLYFIPSSSAEKENRSKITEARKEHRKRYQEVEQASSFPKAAPANQPSADNLKFFSKKPEAKEMAEKPVEDNENVDDKENSQTNGKK